MAKSAETTRRRALAPSEPPPAPERAAAAQWCRGLTSHAWQLVPPMVLVAPNLVRVTLHCTRCDTTRIDRWQQDSGAIDGRHYERSAVYREVCKTDRGATRVGLMVTARPRPLSAAARAREQKGTTHGGEGNALRLVSRTKSRRVRH
jgi:hypothetical protein